MILKRRLANWLQRMLLMRWILAWGLRFWVPRHSVGAVGVIFDEAGRVLLVEHVFRTHCPWGLPGGWIEPYEHPAEAVRREIEEELKLKVEVKRLLLCESQGSEPRSLIRGSSLGMAFYCRLAGEQTPAQAGLEVLSMEWVDPEAFSQRLTAIERRAITLAKQEFDREQSDELFS